MSRALAVLRGVRGSVLWLLSGPGEADSRLRAFAQSQGIEPQRLVFMAKQPHAEYLARLQLADLFLDTEPYNAIPRPPYALWAGCPVLTRPGTYVCRARGWQPQSSSGHAIDEPSTTMRPSSRARSSWAAIPRGSLGCARSLSSAASTVDCSTWTASQATFAAAVTLMAQRRIP
jgi:hypothetical protein